MAVFGFVSQDDELAGARLALLIKRFSELSDDREPQRIMYPLHEVLLLVSCATIASCDDFEDIVAFSKALQGFAEIRNVYRDHSELRIF